MKSIMFSEAIHWIGITFTSPFFPESHTVIHCICIHVTIIFANQYSIANFNFHNWIVLDINISPVTHHYRYVWYCYFKYISLVYPTKKNLSLELQIASITLLAISRSSFCVPIRKYCDCTHIDQYTTFLCG